MSIIGHVCALLVVTTTCVAQVSPERLEASTGPARVDERGWSPQRLLTRAEYEGLAGGERWHVPAERDPWSGDATARYAWLGGEQGSRVSCAVRFAGASPPQVLVDENVNGDLRDDVVRTSVASEGLNRIESRLREPAVPLVLNVSPATADGASPASLLVMGNTLRDGKMTVGEHKIAFAVSGNFGRYGADWHEVYFDTDGRDGLDMGLVSDESYVIGTDEHVNLAGRSWSFAVSPDGATLALTALAEARPDRPRLAPGNPAPDFAFTDVAGAAGRLSDFRGRVVMLYFWGTWCAPCRGETPHLREAHQRFRERGFEILAVAKADEAEAVRSYAVEHAISWRQIVQEADGPIVTLYRAHAVPDTVLVDRAGTIVAHGFRGADIVSEVDRAMGPAPPPAQPPAAD